MATKEIIVTFPERERGCSVGELSLNICGVVSAFKVIPYSTEYCGRQPVVLYSTNCTIKASEGTFFDGNHRIEFFYNKNAQGQEVGGLNVRFITPKSRSFRKRFRWR